MKKGIGISVILLAGLATWYFLIKQNDYIVRFDAPTTTGALKEYVKAWQLTQEDMELVQQAKQNTLQQKVKVSDSTLLLNWEFKTLTDSTSRVVLGAKDLNHSFANRVQAITNTGTIKSITQNFALDFRNGLLKQLENIKIEVDGPASFQPTYAMYIPIKGTQLQKANGMMKYYNYLSQITLDPKITQTGAPFIEVTKWDQKTDSLAFNFCFPIKNAPDLPQFPEVKYKRFYEKEALKATYYGNYISSDRAWHRLLTYAKLEGIAVEKLPLEIFYNNPSYGGNEKSWKADIYLPLKRQ